MKIRLEFDKNQLEVAIHKMEGDLRQVITNTVDAIGQEVVELARSTDKFNHGQYFDDGIQSVMTDATHAEVISRSYTANGVEYSNFMEYGNEAVDGKKMTFQIDGQWITTYKRKAIGAEHLGFMTDAVQTTEGQVEGIFQEQFDKLFK